jgi:glycosyltransferase involved in cell wall biosynthesis
VHLAAPDGHWLDGAELVVFPALVESQPRRLLAALAAGVPVIATPACGIGPRDGLTLVPELDVAALHQALLEALGARAVAA